MVSENNNRIKVAICGGLRSGKDTVGDMIRNGIDAEQFAFSEGIWRMVEIFFPDDYAERHTHKPRTLLQQLGQKLRQIEPDIWVNYTMNKIDEIADNVVVTDMRQPNEYQALKDAGFIIVRVVADIPTRFERAAAAGDTFDIRNLTHETEQHYPYFEVDYEIDNNGNLDDLTQQVTDIVERIFGGRR